MLFLLFRLDEERYALDASLVTEVLPLVGIRPIAHAPPALAGIFNYHGAPVPVIDLSQLAAGRPARRQLNTRIVLVRYRNDGGTHLLGLIAENATETVRREPAEFASSGVANAAAAYLGQVAIDARGMIQKIEVDQLLPASLRELLFRQPLAL